MKAELLTMPDRRQARLADAIGLAVAELLEEGSEIGIALRAEAGPGLTSGAIFTAAAGRPADADARLLEGARALGLTLEDVAAIALAQAVEANPLIPQALRPLQGPDFGSWPCLGLLTRLMETLGLPREPNPWPASRAFDLGILARVGDRVPLSEQRFALAEAVRFALGLAPESSGVAQPLSAGSLPESWQDAAQRLADRIGPEPCCLILRQGDETDRRRYTAALSEAFGRTAMLLPERPAAGLGAAAMLAGWLPVERARTRAGERAPLVELPAFHGPRIAIADGEGGLALDGLDGFDTPLPPLSPENRATLWRTALPGETLPDSLPLHRFGPARIAAIGARARAADGPLPERLRCAMGAELRAEMEPHAQLVSRRVEDSGLVMDEALSADLNLLLARCRVRSLGPAGPDRAPGVRVLFSGPSGTGKTHATAWLATKLGLPLFKLDLASVVSKYIGETEENLARLLDRAEAADSVLLIDEADSLFGARTEAKDSSDRFANNQTNYLLTRIETFDGIVVLTTNGRERFDSAFARRLDQIIEVPLPGAKQRRAIWRYCLGADHALAAAEINRLSALVDLAGGHIRNIAQTAEVLARAEARPVRLADIRVGIDQEYRKIGRTPPGGLTDT